MSNLTIVVTEDGSETLFSRQSGEHYHSIHGALQESMHVFINAGLRCVPVAEDIRILEVGFGTGLNCLLTLTETSSCKRITEYYATEPFPVSKKLAASLNYCRTGHLYDYQKEFLKMHQLHDGEVLLSSDFRLVRLKSKVEESGFVSGFFNLVYFDAFSSDAQPELWQPEIFAKIRESMILGGILVTYAAKGSVRRALQQSGFATERLPGPPGKREMLRATAI